MMKYYLFLILVFFAVAKGDMGSQRESEPRKGNIQFSPDLIPLVTESLPVFELGDAVLAPQDFLYDIVKNNSRYAEIKPLGDSTFAAYANDTLIAFADSNTGQSTVIPLLESLVPAEEIGSQAKAMADRLALNRSLFPIHTSEQIVALAPITLSRSKSFGKGNATVPEDTLAYVRFQRQVNGYPVYGPGTLAMIAVAANDSIQGLAHRWQPAILTNRSIAPYPRQKIADSILSYLSVRLLRTAKI